MSHANLDTDIQMGLPRAIAQEISDAEIGAPFRWLYNWAYLLIMLIGSALGLVFLWPALNGIVQSNAEAAAISANGISFDFNFGMSFGIGLFLWLISVSALISLMILHLPFRHKAAFYLHSKSEFIGPYPKLYGLHRIFKTPLPFHNGGEYIDAICRTMISKLLKIILPGLALVIGLVWLEMSWYSISTPTEYHNNAFFSKSIKTRSWNKATEVEVGCNFVKKRNGKHSSQARSSVIYKVKWSDGTKVRLSIENQINGKSWLDNFETIDSSIRSGNALIKRWVWLKRNPLHPNCLNHFRTELGPDNSARFDRLLRIGELD